MPRFKYFNPYYQQQSYKCPTDWRSRRAYELLQECRPTRASPRGTYLSEAVEGKAVVRFCRYLKAMDEGYRSERKQAKLMQTYFDIEGAKALERKADARRLELRLRLLAGQSAEAIASKMGIDHRIVFAYSIYYFDVRDSVHQQRFIQRLQWQISAGVHEHDGVKFGLFEIYCYVAAHAFGPATIPIFVDAFAHYGQAHDLTSAIGRQREATEIHFSSKILPSNTQSLRYYLALMRRNSTKMYRTENFTTVFADHIARKLHEKVVPLPREVVDVDAVPPQTRRKSLKNEALVV